MFLDREAELAFLRTLRDSYPQPARTPTTTPCCWSTRPALTRSCG